MLRHNTESIKESIRKRFISQEQKDIFDGFEDRFIDKEDTYSKKEMDEYINELNNTFVVKKDKVAHIGNSTNGFLSEIAVFGETEQKTEIIEFSPEMTDGAVSFEDGREFEFAERRRTGFISVKHGDIISFVKTSNKSEPTPVNCTRYDNNKNFICGDNTRGEIQIIQQGVEFIRFYIATYEPDVTVIIKRRQLNNIISVGTETEDGQYALNIVSCGKNLFNVEEYYSRIKHISGVTRTEKGINFDTTDTFVGSELAKIPVFNNFKKNTRYIMQFKYVNKGDFKCRFRFVYDDGTETLVNPTNGLYSIVSDEGKSVVGVKVVWNTQYNGGSTLLEDIMICEYDGEETVEYEAYQESRNHILLPVQLEKVGSNSDRLVRRSDGVWCIEKNIKTRVINKDDFFNHQKDLDDDTTQRYYMILGDAKLLGKGYTNIICDTLPCYVGIGYDGPLYLHDTNVYLHNTENRMDIRRHITSETRFNSIEQLKTFLEGAIIKYPVQNPEIIELPLNVQIELKSFEGATNVFVENSNLVPVVTAKAPVSVQASVKSIDNELQEVNNRIQRAKNLKTGMSVKGKSEEGRVLLQNTNGGVVSDIYIEGDTKVNLLDNNQMFEAGISQENVNYIDWEDSKGCAKMNIKDNSNLSGYYYFRAGRLSPNLKNNTVYTVYIGKCKGLKSAAFCSANYRDHIADKCNVRKDGIVVLTTNETCEATLNNPVYKIYLYLTVEPTVGEKIVGDVVILEGDHSDKPISFFEGIKSVGSKETTIVSRTKNLLIKENCIRHKYQNYNTAMGHVDIIDNQEYCITEFIKVKPNTQYTINTLGGMFYDKDKNLIPKCIYQESTFTTPDDARYMVLNIPTCDFDKEHQVVEGDTLIDFVPGKRNEKALIYYDEVAKQYKPVVELHGTSKLRDSIEKHADGKWYYHKRCDKVTFDGSENWNLETNSANHSQNIYRMCIPYKPLKENRAGILSDKFTFKTDYVVTAETGEGIFGSLNRGTASTLFIDILKSRLAGVDTPAIEFKAWLASNPVTVVYDLFDEEVYELISLDLDAYDTDTIVELYSDIKPSVISASSSGFVSNVVANIRDRVSKIEDLLLKQMIFQNKMMLLNLYNADKTNLKVDISTMSTFGEESEDYELYNLIYKNIVVGVNNYDIAQMEEIIDFYTMINKLTFEMADSLFELMNSQF